MDRKPEAVRLCMDVNVLGTFFTAQLCAIQMKKQARIEGSSQAGSIVMIASIAARQASRGQFLSDYCASKGAVASLAKEIAVELAEESIRVNYISPG